MFLGRGGRGGVARPHVPTSTEPIARAAHGRTVRRSGHAGRLLALTGAVLAVIVLGAACGQYPGVHSESVANQQPAVATAPQPPSSPVSGVESDPSSTTSTTTTTAKKSH